MRGSEVPAVIGNTSPISSNEFTHAEKKNQNKTKNPKPFAFKHSKENNRGNKVSVSL